MCCAVVADSSPAILPRRLLEYECLDESAEVDDGSDDSGDENYKKNLESKTSM